MRTISENELGRFPRVVRNGKGIDADVSDRECGIALDWTDLDIGIEEIFQAAQGAARDPDGYMVPPSEACDATDMVVVLVSHDDGGESIWRNAEATEPPGGVRQSETAVDEYASGADLDYQRVTLAAAA